MNILSFKIMELQVSLTRKTIIKLSQEEIKEALVLYLEKKGVKDANQHLTFSFKETRDERGTELDIVILNYNKDKNIL